VAAIVVGFVKKESAALLRHDKLHVFAVHAGAGAVGMCLTGLLAEYVVPEWKISPEHTLIISQCYHCRLGWPFYLAAPRVFQGASSRVSDVETCSSFMRAPSNHCYLSNHSYQVADVLAAGSYSFAMTIAILNFMKFSVYLFKKCLDRNTNLKDASGYYKRNPDGTYEMDGPDRFKIRVFVDDLQATQPQRWRDDPVLQTSMAPPPADGDAVVAAADLRPPAPRDGPGTVDAGAPPG
jgi:hypothetical protein